MNFLFAHNTFLGQFEHFAKWLLDQGHDVVVIHRNPVKDPDSRFTCIQFEPLFFVPDSTPFLLKESNNAVANAAGVAKALLPLRRMGYVPDVMMAHCGWGTGLMLRNLWPNSVYIAYHEWFYRQDPLSTSRFISEIESTEGNRPLVQDVAHDLARNFPIMAEYVNADACWSPNSFQAMQFPPFFREKMSIIHDGVDTDFFCPDANAEIELNGVDLRGEKKIVTYVGRGFEPIRGFPDFMQAVKLAQQHLPDAHFVVVGSNRVAYGQQLPNGETWLHRMIDQLDLDMSRIHLVGQLSYHDYRTVLQASTVHVYLTNPFVLSWSFSEALATGCNIIASDMPAIREIVEHGKHATLIRTGDKEGLAKAIVDAVEQPHKFQKQRERARRRMIDEYHNENIFKKKLHMIRDLISKRRNIQ